MVEALGPHKQRSHTVVEPLALCPTAAIRAQDNTPRGGLTQSLCPLLGRLLNMAKTAPSRPKRATKAVVHRKPAGRTTANKKQSSSVVHEKPTSTTTTEDKAADATVTASTFAEEKPHTTVTGSLPSDIGPTWICTRFMKRRPWQLSNINFYNDRCVEKWVKVLPTSSWRAAEGKLTDVP